MHVLCGVLLLAPGQPAPAWRVPAVPPLVVVARVSGGRLLCETAEEVAVTKQRRVRVSTPDGQVREVVVPEMVLQMQKKVRAYDLGTARFTDAAGKKVAAAEARKRLGKGAVILLSGNGGPVDEAYRKLFEGDTLVVVAREVAGKGEPLKMPANPPRVAPVPLEPKP